MSVGVDIGLSFLAPRVSPVSPLAPAGPRSAPYLTSIKDDQGNELVIDAVVTATPNRRVNVTKHPVEVGVNITDHARPEPVQLTLECYVSNTPILAGATRTVFFRGIGIQSNTDADSPPGSPGAAEDAYAFLNDLCDLPRLVTVDRQRATYDNMMVTSVSEPETAKDGDGIRFTVELQQVVFVAAKRAAAQLRAGKPRHKGKGPQPNVQPPPDRTWLRRGADSLVGGL